MNLLGFPEDVSFEIMQYVDTLGLSRMIRISKEMANSVHAFLRLKYQQTFETFMRSIVCTRTPSRRILLRYSAPKKMTNKLERVKYACGRCGKTTTDIASCEACNKAYNHAIKHT